MKIFTLEDGRVTEGATIKKYSPIMEIEFPAIIIGENGRGRKLGVLPVGGVTGEETILNATVGTTRRGGPKLITPFWNPPSSTTEEEKCIIVFRSPIGFRGGNQHTGDRVNTPCPLRGWVGHSYDIQEILVQQKEPPYEMVSQRQCTKCKTVFGKHSHPTQTNEPHPDTGEAFSFLPFPGEVLIEGHIAQGDAGRAGAGTQLIAIIPKNVVFRVGYTGRRYDSPKAHYGLWDGQKLQVMTWEDRQVADLW